MAKSQHHPSYRPVPPLLRAMREDAGLTQRALGARLSRPHSWVYNLRDSEPARGRCRIRALVPCLRRGPGCGTHGVYGSPNHCPRGQRQNPANHTPLMDRHCRWWVPPMLLLNAHDGPA